jgi:flagellar hook-associated protein 2
MTIDDSKLTSALQTNFEDVKKLFVDYGSSPSSLFEYIDHTDNTQGGTYSVAITQAATRTTVTGGTALAGTLSAGETLAITDYASGRVANVSLTAGMNIDDIVNAANSEFAKTYTEQLKSTSGDAAQSSSTLFSAVTGADNGDVITFSGKRRNGLSVSGSYTVNTTHTLGNLLSSIEDMFQDEVTVSLEAGTGKLVITDTQAGDSQLEFTIDTSAVPGLNFGTVSTTTAGRNAITITASKGTGGDANKLVLTHNTYGTGHPIVVSETGGTALGMASAVQVYGLNVAGTINGVAATGSGQTLTLSSSGNNADGLSITYSGTTTTTTAFTLSLGIADLLDRQLGFITNSTDGYVPFKQTSLQDSIDDFDIQIKGMEAQLDRKMESMINQFVAMEKALSQLQNQSSWLTAQINGLNKL